MHILNIPHYKNHKRRQFMKIKAAVVREKSGPFLIEDIELDEPGEGEILVRIAGCGLCHTDLTARNQDMPVKLPGVYGHEGSGIVEKTGVGVKKIKTGDHVVMSYDSCGVCDSCLKGFPSHCDAFPFLNFFSTRPDGTATMKKGKETIYGSFFGQSSFASYALASERNTVKVPDYIPIELLGPLGCAIQTGAGGVINSLNAKPGTSIAVFGAGSVGISAIMAAVVSGCTKIIAVDINEGRLNTARGFGATHVINSGKSDPVAEIQKITGQGVNYSLECTAIPKVFRQAVDSLKMGGKCGLIGAAAFGTEVTFDMLNILNGRTITGIVMGDGVPGIFIPKLIELYQQGRFPFDKMIKFYPFDQINQAAEDSEKGRTLKAVLRP
jgi:aryl-alcohol dehydrogenase